MKGAVTLVFAAALSASAAFAKGPDKYIYDPAHTQIMFSADHLGFSHPHGRFDKFSGGFAFDPAHPDQSKIDVTIDANSIDMGSDEWDRAMKGDNFLNTKKFPSITFK